MASTAYWLLRLRTATTRVLRDVSRRGYSGGVRGRTTHANPSTIFGVSACQLHHHQHCCRHGQRWNSTGSDNNSDHSVTIGDVRIASAPRGSGRPDLIPPLPVTAQAGAEAYLPLPTQSHLRWMLQKDLGLSQDFLLLGPPSLARDRRHLLFLYAALVEREVEYVALSRDTSDADLKQRKEVVLGQSTYVPQAPVRAALHGRLLILDGLEKAERNVLPTLNNLLENRELSLDDGGLLVAPHVYDAHFNSTDVNNSNMDSSVSNIYRVHPDFRVAALASSGALLDPPLRSRFQARVAHPLPPGDMLQAISAIPDRRLTVETMQELVQLAAAVPEGMALESIQDAARYLEQQPNSLSPWAVMQAQGYKGGRIAVGHLQGPLQLLDRNGNNNQHLLASSTSTTSSSFVETPATDAVMDLVVAAMNSGSRSVALVGPKGCGKSAIARQAARRQGAPEALFSLYSDMTARDLLLTRGTDEQGSTVWRPTPLTRAVQQGTWVVLDGIDKLRADALTSLALLMEQGYVDLPSGTRLEAKPGFKCLALAYPPPEDHSSSWITPEVAGMFHWIQVDPLSSPDLQKVLQGLYPSVDATVIQQIVNLRDRLDQAVHGGAADTLDEQESMVLSLRKIKHIVKRLLHRRDATHEDTLSQLVHNALLTSLMPDRERRIVQACMADCSIVEGPTGARKKKRQQRSYMQPPPPPPKLELNEELVAACRRTPSHPLLVPNPRFEENQGHFQVLQDLLAAHSVGERALLIMGYQGVGKNRVIDFLLSKLQCEREYLQLHRDTTVQSLLSAPSVEQGRIVYGDSPLIRAAKHGRILVVDEADKAPVEVVALLKGLIEDGELAIPDGRILRYDVDETLGSDVGAIQIHPDFRVWALANPAGYPFQGNDLCAEMADVFSCHTVPPLDAESQMRILKSYGPGVDEEVIASIVDIWQDLRDAHGKGAMAYPFSVREAVSVVKHLSAFPADGIDGALENVIAFDRFDGALLKQLDSVFGRYGVALLKDRAATASLAGTEGGVSTPRTRTSNPKHGKVDPNNDPHVGGNTWAGGTGGSDTAGLGGRGGPYRLDSGHPVHQVSDTMKAEVSEEARLRAREMAKEALEQKLKELNMDEFSWDRYNHLHAQVEVQIQQLQVLLKDIKRRKQERVWLKRQATGELDDSRIVDALAGEKDVFKRRGKADDSYATALRESEPMKIKLVVDVSASMYRFNGYDGRLQRLLEGTLMIMEALKEDERFQLTIVGHNGTSANIPFVNTNTPRDPKTQLKILEAMVAHTQYTYAGDRTLEAIESAVSDANQGDLILVISDANLKRYRIEPDEVSDILRRKDLHAHLIFVGSMGEEANALARSIPNGRAQVCMDSEELPLIIKNIVAAAAK